MKKRGLKLFAGLVGALALIAVSVVTMRAENVSADDGFTYSDKGTYIVITKYSGSSSSVTIPSTHDGKPVTEIGARAFYNNTTIKSVTIPSTVTTIGSGAFMKCTNLTDITIPDSVVSIADTFGWSGVKTVYIGKNVKRISNQTFQSCGNLQKVTVANPDIIWGNTSTAVGTINLTGNPKFTICAPSGSTSQTFAKNNNLSFEIYSGGSSSGGSSGGNSGGSSSECSHDWLKDESAPYKAATCTTSGYIGHVCTKCGETRVVNLAINPDAHQQRSGWETVKLATSSSNGEAVIKCLACGKIIEWKELYYNGGEGEVMTVAPTNNTDNGGNSGNSGNSDNSGGNSGNGSDNSGSGNSGNSGSNGSSDNSGGNSGNGSGNSGGNSGNGSDNSGNSTGADNLDYSDNNSVADANNDLSILHPDKVIGRNRQVKSIPIFVIIGVIVVILGIGAFVIKKRQ